MNDEKRLAEVLVCEALDHPNLDYLKIDPAAVLTELKKDILQQPRVMAQDRFIYRTIILTLSPVSLAVTGAVIYLEVVNHGKVNHFPEILTVLGSAALGALAGIMIPNQRG